MTTNNRMDKDEEPMTTNISHSSWLRACTILSLLACVGALRAAEPTRPRTPPRIQGASFAKGGLSDPCAVGPMAQAGPEVAAIPDSAIPLSSLLSRMKSEGPAARTESGQGGPLAQTLWSNRVAAPEQAKEAEASLALKRLVRQVRSVKFEDQNVGPTFQPPAESNSLAETLDGQLAEVNTMGKTASASPAVATSAEGSTPSKTQKTLDTLRQNPDQVRDPLEIAELLFLSGRAKEATPFYAKALQNISPGDPATEADRAWVLFQLGNCLRETDTAKAQETYMKLVAEYPTSPWTELAKAHGRLLTWYQKNPSAQTTASPQL